MRPLKDDGIPAGIGSLFAAAGLALDAQQFAALLLFAGQLLTQGRESGVTGARDAEEVWRKHLLDSLLLFRATAVPPGASLIDVGAGGGLPGLALKLYRPDLAITLLDAMQRRAEFAQAAVAALGLQGVSIAWGRAEDMGRKDGWRERFHLAVARAVASLTVLAEYCLPFVRVGGEFVAYKGPAAQEEATAAQRAIALLGGEIEEVWQGRLPGAGEQRALVVIKKVKPTPPQYPRRVGVPAKKPL